MVIEELRKTGIEYTNIQLGMVDIPGEIKPQVRGQLKKALKKSGLELMDDKGSLLIENAKRVIMESIHDSEEMPVDSYIDFITRKLQCNYAYLSSLFSEVEGITLQKYIIINKIEKAKELLLYDNLNLTEISYRLRYSSVAHLSNQFKKITGLSPSFFRKLQQERRNNYLNMVTM